MKKYFDTISYQTVKCFKINSFYMYVINKNKITNSKYITFIRKISQILLNIIYNLFTLEFNLSTYFMILTIFFFSLVFPF